MVCNANRNERSRGRSLLRGQEMGTTQNRGSVVEQRLAVGDGWRLATVGGWRSLTKQKKWGPEEGLWARPLQPLQPAKAAMHRPSRMRVRPL